MLKQGSARVIRLALFSPNRNAATETFIKAHIERLPFDVHPQFGGELSIEDVSGRKVWFWGYWLGAFGRRAAPKVYASIRTFFLARYLRSIKVDAVLAEYGVTGSYLAPACAKANIPLFVHFHGFDASVREVLIHEQDAYQAMFDFSSGIVAASIAMKKALLTLGAQESRLIVSPYGVDPEAFYGSLPEKSAPEFLAVGRFVEKKAPYLTILAFSRVVQVVPDAKLTIVGIGPLVGPSERMIQALHLEKSVQLLGVCNPDEVSRLMRRSRAFVQHSLVAKSGDSEGTPVAIIEAQMSGLPVVSTRHAGIPDVVLDGKTGFIVEESDVDGMADAMIRLAMEPELAGQMGAAARVRAVGHFTMDRHINHLAEMIQQGVQKYRQSRG